MMSAQSAEKAGSAARNRKLEYQKQWRKDNPGSYKQWKYGLSQEKYDEMLEQQKHRCAICETTDPKGRHNKFQIDHCHKTGDIRGLLCWACNAGLGQFKDSMKNLMRAHEYLRNY